MRLFSLILVFTIFVSNGHAQGFVFPTSGLVSNTFAFFQSLTKFAVLKNDKEEEISVNENSIRQLLSNGTTSNSFLFNTQGEIIRLETRAIFLKKKLQIFANMYKGENEVPFAETLIEHNTSNSVLSLSQNISLAAQMFYSDLLTTPIVKFQKSKRSLLERIENFFLPSAIAGTFNSSPIAINKMIHYSALLALKNRDKSQFDGQSKKNKIIKSLSDVINGLFK